MAKIADPVTPGQLITASLMNSILEKLSSIEDRVAALEASGRPGGAAIITGLSAGESASSPIKVGQILTVFGQNFKFSVGSQDVRIDNTPVNAFRGDSNDQQLVFTIPTSIVDVPAQGRTSTLSVSNGIQPPATRRFFLAPAFILEGGVDVDYIGPSEGDLTPTQPTTFEFSMTSRATLGATYGIRPLVTGIASAAAFNANLQVLDERKQLVPAKTITLNAGETRAFFIKINPVPAGSSGPFTLTVDAVSGASSGSSGAQTLTVGQAPPTPDPTTLNLSTNLLFPDTGGSITATQIRLKSSAQAQLTFQAIFTAVGSYDVTAVMTAGKDWSFDLFAETTTSPVDITDADLRNANSSASRLLDFIVGPNVTTGHTPSTTGRVEFRVTNRANSKFRAYGMDLTLAP